MNWKTLLPRLLLVGVGFALAASMIWITLELFPEWRPGGQRFIFTDEDGDTFRHQPGFVRPPSENRVLEDFIRRTTKDGFREPRMTSDEYTIIALGDSFTEGGETPWVDVLATELDTPVQNLGWRGWGTLEQAEALKQFGNDDPDWILIGYFEGNDLSNIQTAYQQYQSTGEINIDRVSEISAKDAEPFEIVINPDGNYLYPLQHNIGEAVIELAYISDYIWWLNGTKDTYAQSQNIMLLHQALSDIKATATNACIALVYIPTKGHIYFPYANPQGNQQYVLENSLTLQLDSEGWLTFGALQMLDFDQVYANFNNQREVIQQITEDVGIQFIDLVPVFENAVETLPPTYYTYDSHWSQAGHNLAGATVADFIQQTPCG